MLYLFAILAIAAVFISCWSLLMALNPKHWRLWWMTLMGIPDLNSKREQKRVQQYRLMLAAYIVLFLMLFAAVFFTWQVFEEIHDLQNKSAFDKTRDNTMRDVEKFKGRFNKLK